MRLLTLATHVAWASWRYSSVRGRLSPLPLVTHGGWGYSGIAAVAAMRYVCSGPGGRRTPYAGIAALPAAGSSGYNHRIRLPPKGPPPGSLATVVATSCTAWRTPKLPQIQYIKCMV